MHRELGKIAKEIKLDNLFVKYNQKYRQIERKFKKNKRLIRAKKAQNITYNNILLNYHAIPTNEEIAQLRMELLPKSNTFNSNRNLYDNKIFQYWHQGDSLFKAEKCGGSWKTVHKLSYLSIERYYQDKHILIDYDSIYDYINFTPELNKTINNLLKNNRLASISDLFRTILLFLYGGVWCDFTVVLFNRIPENLLKKDLFFYVRGNKIPDYTIYEAYNPTYFCWDNDFKVRVLNSFICAKHDNRFLGVLLYKLLQYMSCDENVTTMHYFIYQIMFDYLIRTSFQDLYSDLSKYYSDAECHILHKDAAVNFSEKRYFEIKNCYPIQKLNSSLPFIKGCLLYESIIKEGF